MHIPADPQAMGRATLNRIPRCWPGAGGANGGVDRRATSLEGWVEPISVSALRPRRQQRREVCANCSRHVATRLSWHAVSCQSGTGQRQHTPVVLANLDDRISLIVATLGGSALTIWDLHQQAIEQHRLAVHNLSIGVNRADLALCASRRSGAARGAGACRRVGSSNAYDSAQAIKTAATRDFLRAKNLPQANAYVVLERTGTD